MVQRFMAQIRKDFMLNLRSSVQRLGLSGPRGNSASSFISIRTVHTHRSLEYALRLDNENVMEQWMGLSSCR